MSHLLLASVTIMLILFAYVLILEARLYFNESLNEENRTKARVYNNCLWNALIGTIALTLIAFTLQ